MDEAHYIKNPKAQRTKFITKAFKKIPKKLLLSGTAIKSKPFEFFVLFQLHFIFIQQQRSQSLSDNDNVPFSVELYQATQLSESL